MMEMVVFALTFVVAQMICGVLTMYVSFKIFMNKKFIKKWVETSMEIGKEIQEELEEDF